MTYTQLLEFVQDQMPKRMQHISLPILLDKLVECDGAATIRQLAEAFLAKDDHVMYYEKRLREMPLRALSEHDLITSKGYQISLNIKKLTLEQKSIIKMLCEKALREFIDKKGLDKWITGYLTQTLFPTA